MEIVIYNARPIQKVFTMIEALVLIFLCLLGYFLGGMYKNIIDSIIMFSIIGGVIIAAFIVYFLTRTLTDSRFVFDEKYITQYKKKIVVLKIEWEQVTSIGHFKILDIFNYEWGPGLMGIDYLDKNNVEKKIQVVFSLSNAKRLKESHLNSKLDNFINPR